VSEYPKRLKEGNINTPAYWDGIWLSEAGLKRIDTDRFANMAGMLNRDETILDVAGGLGEFLIFLRAAGFTNTLMHADQSQYAVDRVRMAGFSSQLASAYQLPFAAKHFDAVTLGEILEHLDEPAKAVAEAARVARRTVVVSTPYLTALNGDPEHVWAWDLDAVYDLLAPHGRVRLVLTHEGRIVVASATRE